MYVQLVLACDVFQRWFVLAPDTFAVSPIDWQDEEAWLRGVIIRLRTLLRFARHPEVEAGLKDIVGDAERRLEHLQHQQFDPFDEAPGG